MRLYLVRHGEALPSSKDPECPLSESGKKNAEKVAVFLKSKRTVIDVMISSIKTRAIETANILSEYLLPDEKVEQKEGLTPNDDIKNILIEIEAEERNLMLVGHLPFLQKLASKLLAENENKVLIKFNNVSVICLEKVADGYWQLVFSINPELL